MQLFICLLQWSPTELPTTTEVWKWSSCNFTHKPQKSSHKCSQLFLAFDLKPRPFELLLTELWNAHCHTPAAWWVRRGASGSRWLPCGSMWLSMYMGAILFPYGKLMTSIKWINWFNGFLKCLRIFPAHAAPSSNRNLWLKTFKPLNNNRRLPPFPHFETFLSCKLYIFTYLPIMYHFKTVQSRQHFSGLVINKLQMHPPLTKDAKVVKHEKGWSKPAPVLATA